MLTTGRVAYARRGLRTGKGCWELRTSRKHDRGSRAVISPSRLHILSTMGFPVLLSPYAQVCWARAYHQIGIERLHNASKARSITLWKVVTAPRYVCLLNRCKNAFFGGLSGCALFKPSVFTPIVSVFQDEHTCSSVRMSTLLPAVLRLQPLHHGHITSAFLAPPLCTPHTLKPTAAHRSQPYPITAESTGLASQALESLACIAPTVGRHKHTMHWRCLQIAFKQTAR